MSHLRTIFVFGWPYLRKYWARLFLGIFLGVIFGFSTSAILGAANTILQRIDPQTNITRKEPSSVSKLIPASLIELKNKSLRAIDPWLPKAGRPIDGNQIAGVLLLLPFLFALRGFVGYFSSYFMGWVSERVINDLRVDVLIKLNSLSLDFFNRSTMGDLLTRINSDTASLQRTLNLGFSDLIKEPITIL